MDKYYLNINQLMLTKLERDYMAAVLDEFLNDDGIENEDAVNGVLNDNSENKDKIRYFGWKLREKLLHANGEQNEK